jgi:hypothetical protein
VIRTGIFILLAIGSLAQAEAQAGAPESSLADPRGVAALARLASKTGLQPTIAYWALVGHKPDAAVQLVGYSSRMGLRALREGYAKAREDSKKRCGALAGTAYSKPDPEALCVKEPTILQTRLAELESIFRLPSTRANLPSKLHLAATIYGQEALLALKSDRKLSFEEKASALGVVLDLTEAAQAAYEGKDPEPSQIQRLKTAFAGKE